MKDTRTTGQPERAGFASRGSRAILRGWGFDPPRRVSPSGGWEKTRLEALSDGVFGVALTLLIVDLATANFPSSFSDPKWHEFLRRIGAWLYILAIVGVYWVAHHNEMRTIDKVDRMMLWINLLFLCLVVLLPFSAVMAAIYWTPENKILFWNLGFENFRPGDLLDRVPVVVHGVNLGSAGLVLDWLWRRAKKHGFLVNMSNQDIIRTQRRNKLIPALSFSVAFLGDVYPQCAVLFPLVPATYIVLSISYAHEVTRQRATAKERFHGG